MSALFAFRDRDGTDAEYAGAALIVDLMRDIALIRSAYQKK